MMVRKTKKRANRGLPPLEKRFNFLGDAVAPGDKKVLRSAQFEVLDQISGFERNLKLWRKTGKPVDADLRQLWLHEMRQVQRVMSYAGAREVIVDILEFVEDAENFGVLLEHAGQPLSAKLLRVSRQGTVKLWIDLAQRGWLVQPSRGSDMCNFTPDLHGGCAQVPMICRRHCVATKMKQIGDLIMD